MSFWQVRRTLFKLCRRSSTLQFRYIYSMLHWIINHLLWSVTFVYLVNIELLRSILMFCQMSIKCFRLISRRNALVIEYRNNVRRRFSKCFFLQISEDMKRSKSIIVTRSTTTFIFGIPQMDSFIFSIDDNTCSMKQHQKVHAQVYVLVRTQSMCALLRAYCLDLQAQKSKPMLRRLQNHDN